MFPQRQVIFTRMAQSFQLVEPRPLLRPYIKHYWILEDDSRRPVSERTLPTGSLQLIFHRGKPLHWSGLLTKEVGAAAQPVWQPQVFLAGQSLGFSDVVSNGPIEMIAVVFRPFASNLFFRIPADRFYNRLVDVQDMEDRELSRLGFRVEEASGPAEAIRLIEDFLSVRLTLGAPYNLQRMQAALQTAYLCPELNVEQWAQAVCLSKKQFGRLFTSYVGATPKAFLRIIRMQRALHLLAQSPGLPLAQLAYAAGFSDQSHLIKEFRFFSGYTPTQYLAVCAPHSDYFSED